MWNYGDGNLPKLNKVETKICDCMVCHTAQRKVTTFL